MDLSEKILYLAIGAAVGFIAGFIVGRLNEVKEELDEVKDMLEHDRDRPETGAAKRWPLQSIALFMVVLVVAIGAIQSQITSNKVSKQQDYEAARVKQDLIERCLGGVDTRTVQRDTIEAFYNLATATLPRGQRAAELDAESRKRYNSFIDDLNEFRTDMYAKIKPSKPCLPYVTDDNIKPPPPPYPRFPDPTN